MGEKSRASAWAVRVAAVSLALGAIWAWSNHTRTPLPTRPDTRDAPGRSVPESSGPRPALPAAAASARAPQVWAIVIGIDRYQSVPRCRGAVRDAHAVHRWFVETAGWDRRNVLLLDDEGRAGPDEPGGAVENLRPTRNNLQWAVQGWLGPRTGPEDIVVIYFAGQAVALPSRRGSSGHNGQERLLPIDANPADFETTGWSIESAIEGLSPGHGRSIVCWLDTSLEGRGEPVLRGGDEKPSGARWLSKLVRWPGVTAWLAADGKPSAEAAADPTSPFTAALLGALGTRAKAADLMECLDHLRGDERTAGQGFRARGGIAQGLTLWPERARARAKRKPELLLQRGHADRVTSLAFTPDGERLVSASMDSTVKVWDVSGFSLTLVRDIAHRLENATCMALSPDRRWVVAGDNAGGMLSLDLRDLLEPTLKQVHAVGLERLAFLPDGSHFVSLDRLGKVWWWDLDDPARGVTPLAADGSDLACAVRAGGAAVALAHRDGKVSLFGPDRERIGMVDGSGEVIDSLALSHDGRLLALGDDRGVVSVHKVGGDGGVTRLGPFDGKVHRLMFSPAGLLAVGAGEFLHLVEPSAPGHGGRLAADGRVGQVVFSADGRRLACCTAVEGLVLAWDVTDPRSPRPILPAPAVGIEERSNILCLTFSPDGSTLLGGGGDGAIRMWDLERGELRESVPRHRGQVVGLSSSPDGRFLLQVTRDLKALVWDLEQGRTLTRLPGEWTSGAILPDMSGYVLTSREGEAVVVGRDGRPGRPLRRPASPDGGPLEVAFTGARVSPDGRWVAVATSGDLAVLWERRKDVPIPLGGHDDRVTSVDFSADSRSVVTSGEDGTARRWDLDTVATSLPLVLSAPDDADEGTRALTVARVCPTDPRRVAAGTRGGRIFLWDGTTRPDRPVVLRAPCREVKALDFSGDGRWLAAAGVGPTIGLWKVDGGRIEAVVLEPRPHHSGAINALVGWPGGGLMASGGDDTTVRLWALDRRELLGTLAAEQDADRWVIYTPAPDGLFDGSGAGQKQVTWLVDGEVRPLEQYYKTHHVFGLGAVLRQGRRPPAPVPLPDPPPVLWIDPPAEPDPGSREVELTIRLGESGLSDVRLYHDNVAVRSDSDFGLDPGRRLLSARVRLHAGENRFYAMAGRPSSIDGRSRDVTLRHDGPTPGQLHILALGISRYTGRPLRFADADARRIAAYLHGHGISEPNEPGLNLVLTNDEVTADNVTHAFRLIRDRARPEDTVVLFLAGHTDVLRGQFHLLLPEFPFPARRPPLVAARGGGAGQDDAASNAALVLPYAELYSHLARLDALRRLVIIDACHSSAVFDDGAVRMIQETLEGVAYAARTSYILAARRDDPANEVEALRHGLLTYVLLRGMGERDLEKVPDPSVFDGLPDADRDHDHQITTGELRDYAAAILPKLITQFPELTQRAGDSASPGRSPALPDTEANSLRTNTASFPLLVLPREKEKAGR